ncbi:MAG: hypothetical protein J0L84_13655, partial [Verrucomicrobia bacterium]|nr:hypothetical protein [Verrucomicrobiota bacterium]
MATVLAVWAGAALLDAGASEPVSATPLAPAISLGTGLLLEPPLDLSGLTREQFLKMAATIGPHRIQRPWTSPVVALPPHPRSGAQGLTEAEISDYMAEARRRFD